MVVKQIAFGKCKQSDVTYYPCGRKCHKRLDYRYYSMLVVNGSKRGTLYCLRTDRISFGTLEQKAWLHEAERPNILSYLH